MYGVCGICTFIEHAPDIEMFSKESKLVSLTQK